MRNASASGFGILLACGSMLVYGAACSSPSSGGDGTGTNTSASTSSGSGNGTAANNGGSTGGDNGSSGGSNGGSSGGSSGGSGSSASAEGGAPATGDQACAAMATADACGTCCETNHTAGSTVMENAFYACMCGAKGACQTQCAKSDCSSDMNAPAPTPGDACDLCEQKAAPGDGTGSCDAPINTACNADADCTALTTCYNACPQQ